MPATTNKRKRRRKPAELAALKHKFDSLKFEVFDIFSEEYRELLKRHGQCDRRDCPQARPYFETNWQRAFDATGIDVKLRSCIHLAHHPVKPDLIEQMQLSIARKLIKATK